MPRPPAPTRLPAPTHGSSARVGGHLARVAALLPGVLAAFPVGCSSLSEVDRKTDIRLKESADRVGNITSLPEYSPSKYQEGEAFPRWPDTVRSPASRNPAAAELDVPILGADQQSPDRVIERFQEIVSLAVDAEPLSFAEAFRFARLNSPEYLNSEEAYIISALRLIIEENRWGPRFFNETGATFSAQGDEDGRYRTALNLVNDLGVTQKLPYGGDFAARLVVAATEQLDNAIGDSSFQNADILLNANIPILRGAGLVAQEPLIQAKRDLIYAARNFESFRRSFYLSLAAEYLQLLFRKTQIATAERQVEQSRLVEQRSIALVESGRSEPFEADQARQNTLFAIDRLATLQDTLRFALDAFKVRIGMDSSRAIDVVDGAFNLPVPATSLERAVRVALDLRLDLQTQSDRVDDAKRRVDVAKNNLLGDLNVQLAADIPTTDSRRRAGLQFRPQSTDYVAGLTYSMPIDRTAEQALYRESQIRLEQSRRDLRQSEDRVAVEARQSVRGIEKAQFSILISRRNVDTSDNRLRSIDAAPDRASVRDRTEAVNNLAAAQDQLSSAERDLQIAILEFLASTGQLRLRTDGAIDLPRGMARAELGLP